MKRSPIRRKRKQPGELERMEAFKAVGDVQGGCMACGDLLDGGWHAHHVVTQQHIRQADGDVWDVRNAMRLCGPCHDAHHNRTRPIPVSCVPDGALDFAIELLGQNGTDAYLARYYGPRRWVGY